MRFTCEQCGKPFECAPAQKGRHGMRIFCSIECCGLSRRKYKTAAQKKAEKAAYYREYKRKNRRRIKARKRAYHLRTYDPAKARIDRKKNMARHVEYCRQPAYKKWKAEYDRRYRSTKLYGEYAEAFLTLQEVQHEILKRASRHQIDQENEKVNKTQRNGRRRQRERWSNGGRRD
jgi:hypothetical protein